MTVSFPELCPTRRSYTPGVYPVKKFDSVSGASVTRLYGSKAFDATLDLQFILSDSSLQLLLASYHASKGGADPMTLPLSVFAGLSPDLQDQIPSYLNWRYAETPSLESLVPGRTRVQVKLIATLDA